MGMLTATTSSTSTTWATIDDADDVARGQDDAARDDRGGDDGGRDRSVQRQAAAEQPAQPERGHQARPSAGRTAGRGRRERPSTADRTPTSPAARARSAPAGRRSGAARPVPAASDRWRRSGWRNGSASSAWCSRGSRKRSRATAATTMNGTVMKYVARSGTTSASSPPASALTTRPTLSTNRIRPIVRSNSVAVAGLLQDRVVGDRLERARLHREEHAQEQRGHDVHAHVGAEPTDHDADDQRRLGEEDDTPPAPPIGQDPRRHLEQRHHRRVRGGHDRDAAVVEADVGHEQLLDRHPQRRRSAGTRPRRPGAAAARRRRGAAPPPRLPSPSRARPAVGRWFRRRTWPHHAQRSWRSAARVGSMLRSIRNSSE